METQIPTNWVEETYIKYGEQIFNIFTVPDMYYPDTPRQVNLIDTILKQFLGGVRKKSAGYSMWRW